MNIFSDLQDQIVQRLRNALVDSDGNAQMRVIRVDHDSEPEIAQWVYDNEKNVSKYPHALVYTGPATTTDPTSTRRGATFEIQIRIFIAVRDASHNNEAAQKKLADKWSLYTAAALNGYRIGFDPYTADEVIENTTISAIANTERSALWEVNMEASLETDYDVILNNVTNE